MHSLFSVEYERAVIHIRAVTSGASCRLDSWCSYRMCAFGSYADWLWLSLAWCWTWKQIITNKWHWLDKERLFLWWSHLIFWHSIHWISEKKTYISIWLFYRQTVFQWNFPKILQIKSYNLKWHEPWRKVLFMSPTLHTHMAMSNCSIHFLFVSSVLQKNWNPCFPCRWIR